MDFDAQSYWQARHKDYAGDPRAVGRLDKTVDENGESTAYLVKNLRAVIPAGSGEALDVGCGTGRLRPLLESLGFSYTGLDFAASGPDVICADISSYRDGQYDLILVAYALVHIVDDVKWRRALRNMARMLKPSGTIIIVDAVHASNHAHVKHRDQTRYQAALMPLGLHMKQVGNRVFRVTRRHRGPLRGCRLEVTYRPPPTSRGP